jgi:hypothetical protein
MNIGLCLNALKGCVYKEELQGGATMKQKHVFSKKWALLLFVLSLASLFILTAMTGENGAAMNDAEMLARLGVKACVPRPSTEPPPAVESSMREDSMAGAGQRPCPEGFVPQPIERWVPKGRPRHEASFEQKSAGTRAAAAAPAVGAKYYYSGAYQFVIRPGSSAFLTQHLPWLLPADHHSLAEIAVQSADTRQIVEVGWTVDRQVNGDDNPHLFVYHWVDGVGTCYNGCGWVQSSPTRFPGMRLAYDGTASQYMIQFREGNWWIGYQGEWIGYFPGSLWTVSFTQSGLIQWFGELAAGSGTTLPLSSIGNYYPATSGNPDTAQMSQITLFDSTGGVQPAVLSFQVTDSALYSAGAGSGPDGFWYGGHGGAP